jgi:hypothetical protein
MTLTHLVNPLKTNKMSELRVGDKFRTNSLSLEPGGYEVTVAYQNGQRLVYDKVKKPGYYIKSISSKNQSYGAITEILIDGKVSWQLGVNDTEPWNI